MQVLFGLSGSSTAAAAVAELGSRKRRNAKLGANDCQPKGIDHGSSKQCIFIKVKHLHKLSSIISLFPVQTFLPFCKLHVL